MTQQEMERVARMFKALSNPHRLRIYNALAACIEDTVQSRPSDGFANRQREFAERLGLAPSTVSHHFKELREAGLLHMKRKGKEVLFWVDGEAARLMRSYLGS